jgi:glycosyltransferase involved in cell wall biosynthesis/SAM-dependent methyltransferase
MIWRASESAVRPFAAWLHRRLYKTAQTVFRATPLKREWKRQIDKFLLRRFPWIIPPSLTPLPRPRKLPEALEAWSREFYRENSDGYEPMSVSPVCQSQIKLIAFYLPQFHPIPENDQWWGKGFTEWSNVARAKPQFAGHYQPHLPGELGFYDLRLKEVQKRQIEIAKHYGIHGFCYYYYWFNGKRLLDLPLNQVLANDDLDHPFCICWANENWTRRWDGQAQEILLEQRHSPENDFKFIDDIASILTDRRYIRIANKPLLIVYRPDVLPEARTTLLRWRNYCRHAGVGDIYLVAARTFGFEDPTPLGFDAAMEFPPHGVAARDITDDVPLLNPFFQGRIFRYQDMVEQSRAFAVQAYPVFRTVIPAWDNTARRGNTGHLFLGNSPRLYQTWLEAVCEDTIRRFREEERFVFVNAWNEWAEGAHLEPDRRDGYAYLNATASVLRKYNIRNKTQERKRPKISVIVPAYNHEKYINKALDSLQTQTVGDFEVIVVDDGSMDGTARVVERFVENSDLNIRLVVQKNSGAHAAINYGITEAAGEYIAILNSDDFYHPERLETLRSTLGNSDSLLAFSDIEIVGENDAPVSPGDSYAELLRAKISQIARFPRIGYAFLDFNVAVTSGNLFFRRELFDLVGGFSGLQYCHDWDFVLTALRYTTPLFVDRELYSYRLHRQNTFRALQKSAEKESEVVLTKFFQFEQSQPQVRHGFPSHKNDRQYFTRFIKQHGYDGYVRAAVQVGETNSGRADGESCALQEALGSRDAAVLDGLEIWPVLSRLTDEEWLEVLMASIDTPEFRGIELPGFPAEDLQMRFGGSAGAHTLREAFNFYRVVKGYAARLGPPLTPGSRVLDFGCGWGRLTRFFLKDVQAENLCGVDIDHSVIDICQKTFRHGVFKVIQPHPPTDFDDGGMDLICAYSVFSHLAEATHLEWLQEFSRIMRPGGLLVVTTQGRSFLEFCGSLRGRRFHESLWHEALAASFPDMKAAVSDYDSGKFLYSPTGGGDLRSPSFYGEAVIPRGYVEREWTKFLLFRDFIDERAFLPQAVIVMQKSA